MRYLFLLFTLCCFMASPAGERIILLNEGNWQADNGRITYFEDGKIVSNRWFREINGYKLGDTPNDIIRINDNLIAIAINWSNIIQFMTPEGKAVAATENVPNNRKLASDGRYVYVSSYGHECGTVNGIVTFNRGYVAKIDVNTFQVVGTCEVGYEPEGIALYDGHLFVANTGGYAFQEDHEYETTVSIINASTMKLDKNIDTGIINLYGKMSQSGQYLCINSPGDYYDVPASGIIFDCEAALKGEKCFVTIPYAVTYNCTTTDGKFLAIGSRYSYYTGDYTFNYVTIDPEEVIRTAGASGLSNRLPGKMLDTVLKMSQPYGIYVNPYTGYIYATDAGSFAAAGAMYQWDPEGNLKGKFGVYINPAHFLALNPDKNGGVNDIIVDPSIYNRLYDLQGRYVSTPVDGSVYIVNGKKILYRQN